ncbi:MAG: hypothetical protein JRI99_05810 [Deltaproteobacteria bacterium]|nr:hypothetical protein [Deltaproteobacteria bacterium]
MERLDHIEAQLAPLAKSVKDINDFKNDLTPLTNNAIQLMIKELEDVESGFQKEVKMQAKILIVCLLVGVITFIGVFPSTCISGNKEELAKFYEACISSEISKCQAKTTLSKSRSANLRCYAAKNLKKAEFLQSNKDMLIKEMIKNDIGVKPYKIGYFLNKKFYWEKSTNVASGSLEHPCI